MDYSTDRPIHTAEDDLLGRASFSKQLGKAIYEYNGKDGLVIGLFGKWGTGKTSVINMAENEIIHLSEKDENKPLIMRFAPWNYSDKDNLISLFFQSLKNKIDIQDNEEVKKKIGKALNDYSNAFDVLSTIPVLSTGAIVAKMFAKRLGNKWIQDTDLDKTKEILEKVLIDVNKKIIIVIDDIDRLTNSQIRDIFQLVKQVADFPNVIYVLAMDRDVVRSALTEVHNIDGSEYLEKIIQVPFELPELRKSKLHDIFFAKLGQVINNLPNKVEWDESYWSSVFRNCIEPFIHTLRDVNRVVNTFQFRYSLVYQETSFEDMIAITTLEVLEPELYKWIASNKESVCGGFMPEFLSNNSNSDYRKLYYNEFERLKINPDLALSCVSTIFPVFANVINEHQYGYRPISDVRSRMCVADKGRFELYFMFDLDDIKVSRNIINNCIYEFDETTLRITITGINKQGNITYFIEELKSLVDKIPYTRLDLLASVMLNLQGEFKGEEQKYLFSISAKDKAEYLVYDIMNRLETEKERYGLIRSAVENMDKSTCGVMARIINRTELAYGRLVGDSEKEEDQIISLSNLEELEKIYVVRISSIADSESLLDIDEMNIVFYLWQCLDKDGAKFYLEKLFKNTVNKLRFICGLAGRWNGTNGNGWSFFVKSYSEYISQDEIYNTIQSFDKNKLDEFTEIEQIKLASFVLNHHKGGMERTNEQEAMELVNKWKTEK
ncbi:KAP family P-loop NTPase fold protein [Streptococcus caviae]|uniref:KAP family P-loop NTPase fold protein n=1 Tax=Streptococcus sp. 'caviae' TaxID=1915004 RepID=UPI00094B91F3|nr:P-loop NTPase fold protein [Streptococcus sp. 'caviae']OLN83243.1 NTPase [Streptococcus sp. 'caviae']